MAEARRDRSVADESAKSLRAISPRGSAPWPTGSSKSSQRFGALSAATTGEQLLQPVLRYSRRRRAARRVRSTIPGPYKILREPTLAGTVVSDIWRPPTISRETGIYAPTAIVALPLSRGDPPASARLFQRLKEIAPRRWRRMAGLRYSPIAGPVAPSDLDRRQSCALCFSEMWSAGRAASAVIEQLPGLRERYALDFVVVNGENAAGGFGITEPILTELLDAGADVVTTGNHVFDQRETLVFIERHDRLLRPINFPQGTPGQGRRAVQGGQRRRCARDQRQGACSWPISTIRSAPSSARSRPAA